MTELGEVGAVEERGNAGGEGRRKKWDVTKSGFFLHYFLS